MDLDLDFSNETQEKKKTFSVSQISSVIANLLETGLKNVSVAGEIANLSKSPGGHAYFVLKDEDSMISVVCWKSQIKTLGIDLGDGMSVICRGSIKTYPQGSRYQMIVVKAEVVSSRGSFLIKFEELKKKLNKEGLFKIERKRSLPLIPEKIAIITSEQGAVIKDMMHRIKGRFEIPVIFCPVSVQGKAATQQLINAVKIVNILNIKDDLRIDIILIARGGGSAEDLACFNDETLVRQIAESKIPVVSAIGHETDFTLVDFVADLRAPTPSSAIELILPLRVEIEARIVRAIGFATEFMRSKILQAEQKLIGLSRVFEIFLRKINQIKIKIGYLITISKNLIEQKLEIARRRIAVFDHRQGMRIVERFEEKLRNLTLRLEAHNHKKILERGFALIEKEGKLVKRASDLEHDDKIEVNFHDAGVRAKITR